MAPQLQIADILAHFNYHPKVSNKALEQYCTRKNFTFIAETDYEDHLFQYQHDQRALKIVPEVMKALLDYQYIPDYISKAKQQELKAKNEQIEMAITHICEENGLHYREVDVLIKNLASSVGAVITNASNRLNNMCALAISGVAKERFGKELKVKDLAEYLR
jgi:hypothetical protein